MRKFILSSLLIGSAVIALPHDARAIGCFSGGAAGAVGGHMAGHGVVGALGGCVAGHYANKYQKNRAAQQQNSVNTNSPGTVRNNTGGMTDPTQGYPR